LDALASIESTVLKREDSGRIETETLVVDNGSADGSAEAVRERFPWVELIALEENLGFAGGNNVGLRRAKGRHALLLNSDTIVLPDALEACVRYLDAHPRVGVVGPQLLNPDRSKQNCVHNFPGLLSEIVPKGVLETLFPKRFPSKRYAHPEPIEVEAVLGACLFVRGTVLEDVGLMPEDYFFFLEETDWCFQIRRAGWKIVQVPTAHVIHIFGASTKKKLPLPTRIEYHRSLYHFFRKNRGTAHWIAVQGVRIAKQALYVVARAPAALLSARARERWRGDLRLLAWHFAGQPAAWGLSGQRAATAPVEGKEVSA
jgi:GT2 family glycosyltransferase